MVDAEAIRQCLISSRNILLGNRVSADVESSLRAALGGLTVVHSSHVRNILSRCISHAIGRVDEGDFIGAGVALDLAHNLPLSEADEASWDVDYFLTAELTAFLEIFEEINGGRDLILYVLKELGCWYFGD